jgi:hypothetical protein
MTYLKKKSVRMQNPNDISESSNGTGAGDSITVATALPHTTTSSNSSTSGVPYNVGNKAVGLCASCDRCRSRKTKCDGQRPCRNCAAKYLKKHKLSSVKGIDLSEFECVYSPAKRRGPVPGKAGQSRNKAVEEMDMMSIGSLSNAGGGVAPPGVAPGGMGGLSKNSNFMRMDMNNMAMNNMGAFPSTGNNMMLQQHTQQQLAALGMTNMNSNTQGNTTGANQEFQRQLLMQQQQQQLMMSDQQATGMNMNPQSMTNPMSVTMMQQQIQLQQQQQQQVINNMVQQMQQQPQQIGSSISSKPNNNGENPSPAQRMRLNPDQRMQDESNPRTKLAKSVQKHLSLVEKSSMDGNRLRSYYALSIDLLFKFPPVPTDEEYCAKLNIAMNPTVLPQFDLAALRAARFSEIALGALVGNQISLSLELSNAVVACLKQCAEEPVHPSCMYDVARAYFLHGMFRSLRGDMPRYFKYRRVCLAKLSQLATGTKAVEPLLAAISFHDSWAYMIYNANEKSLPNIDQEIPPVTQSGEKVELNTAAENKYQVSTDSSKIASDPKNQMWIQGPPPIFINNEAPPLSRCLDALACAIRSCCDQANTRLLEMSKALGKQHAQQPQKGEDGCQPSLTTKAVMSNNAELCSRNMVLSAFALLRQSEASSKIEKNHGHHLLVSAMDAFLEGGDEEEAGGFTDSQIQSLLSVANSVISRPLLLYQAGPTYHMVSNVAVQLCHLLNGLHANKDKDKSQGQPLGEMESALFNEVLDTYIALRKILNDHRRRLPLLLRCHGLPRPNLLVGNEPGASFIDLGKTLMCASRGCQGFVLMACSPCVAAERAMAAELRHKEEMALFGGVSNEMGGGGDFDSPMNGMQDFGTELNIEDDALISILGKIVAG